MDVLEQVSFGSGLASASSGRPTILEVEAERFPSAGRDALLSAQK